MIYNKARASSTVLQCSTLEAQKKQLVLQSLTSCGQTAIALLPVANAAPNSVKVVVTAGVTLALLKRVGDEFQELGQLYGPSIDTIVGNVRMTQIRKEGALRRFVLPR